MEGAITIFVQAIVDQIESGLVHDIYSFNESPAELLINQHACFLSSKFSNDVIKGVLDSLRHAFCSFACGGLHQLFTHQENENWYPKIILDEKLEPNDISLLPNLVTLYRGTNLAELNLKNYGQSWTTSKDSAHKFAFQHYVGQSWFREDQRIILKTKFSKEDVYFSCQSGEFEVVINTRKLLEVEKCT